MTVKEATEYINNRFDYETEIRSYSQDVTSNGVFNKQQFNNFPDDIKVDIAEDLKQQFKQEFGHLVNFKK